MPIWSWLIILIKYLLPFQIQIRIQYIKFIFLSKLSLSQVFGFVFTMVIQQLKAFNTLRILLQIIHSLTFLILVFYFTLSFFNVFKLLILNVYSLYFILYRNWVVIRIMQHLICLLLLIIQTLIIITYNVMWLIIPKFLLW